MKTKLKNQKGFTIIEVLIVLAIAGLILLIVFLAVPALQRNSRNTQARNTAAAVLGAVNDYASANNGQLPNSCVVAANELTVSGGGSTNDIVINIQEGYDVTGCSDGEAMPGNLGEIAVNLNHKCDGTDFGSSSPRAFAAGFRIETGSSTNPTQCTES